MGAFVAAIGPNPLGVLVAFGAGILSFISPCVLPLVPGYVSMVSGLSAAELNATRPRETGADAHAAMTGPASATLVPSLAGPETGAMVATLQASSSVSAAVTGAPAAQDSPAGSHPHADAPARPSMRPVLRGIGLFIAGFTLVFVALGAAASGIGRLLVSHKDTLTHASGYVVLLLGVILVIGAVPGQWWSRIGAGPRGVFMRLSGQRRITVRPSTLGAWAAPVMGMAFAFAWTPCIGPVLAVVLGLAAHNGSLPGGVLLLFAYSLGLAVPFAAAGLAFGRLTSVLARARRGLWLVELVGGLILVAFGVLLLTNHLGWLSSQFTTLLDHLGLSRLSTS
jgi:cytochrome c-type biogenesis protein